MKLFNSDLGANENGSNPVSYNNSPQRKIIKFILLGIVFLAIIVGLFFSYKVYEKNQPFAIVNGTKITKQQYQSLKESNEKYYKLAGDKDSLKNAAEITKKKLTENTIILTEAEKLGLVAPQKTIDIQYELKSRSYGSAANYGIFLAKYGVTPESVKENIRIEILKKLLERKVLNGSTVTYVTVRYDTYAPPDTSSTIDTAAKNKIDTILSELNAGRPIEDIDNESQGDPRWAAPVVMTGLRSNLNEKTKDQIESNDDWNAIQKLKKPGDTTPVFKSSGGYYAIYKLNFRVNSKFNTWKDYIDSFDASDKVSFLPWIMGNLVQKAVACTANTSSHTSMIIGTLWDQNYNGVNGVGLTMNVQDYNGRCTSDAGATAASYSNTSRYTSALGNGTFNLAGKFGASTGDLTYNKANGGAQCAWTWTLAQNSPNYQSDYLVRMGSNWSTPQKFYDDYIYEGYYVRTTYDVDFNYESGPTTIYGGYSISGGNQVINYRISNANADDLQWYLKPYTYAWQTGSWGACSVTCGGGTQARPVTCQRNDGITVADSYCTAAKPATSQSCNTAACCGNGVINTGEACDLGSSNGTCPATCSASCSVNNNARTLTYDANGGTGAPAATSGTTVTVSSTEPTRSGYFFRGWNDNTSGTGSTYWNGYAINLNCSNKTIYAKWELIVPGCTNSSATNYNPAANQDNGSCTFPCSVSLLINPTNACAIDTTGKVSTTVSGTVSSASTASLAYGDGATLSLGNGAFSYSHTYNYGLTTATATCRGTDNVLKSRTANFTISDCSAGCATKPTIDKDAGTTGDVLANGNVATKNSDTPWPLDINFIRKVTGADTAAPYSLWKSLAKATDGSSSPWTNPLPKPLRYTSLGSYTVDLEGYAKGTYNQNNYYKDNSCSATTTFQVVHPACAISKDASGNAITGLPESKEIIASNVVPQTVIFEASPTGVKPNGIQYFELQRMVSGSYVTVDKFDIPINQKPTKSYKFKGTDNWTNPLDKYFGSQEAEGGQYKITLHASSMTKIIDPLYGTVGIDPAGDCSQSVEFKVKRGPEMTCVISPAKGIAPQSIKAVVQAAQDLYTGTFTLLVSSKTPKPDKTFTTTATTTINGSLFWTGFTDYLLENAGKYFIKVRAQLSGTAPVGTANEIECSAGVDGTPDGSYTVTNPGGGGGGEVAP